MTELMAVGARIYAKVQRQTKNIMRNCDKHILNKTDGPLVVVAFNHADRMSISDIAHIMITDMPCDVVIGYFYVYEQNVPQCVVSIRTNGRVSASETTRALNGGGHQRSAVCHLSGYLSPNDIVHTILTNL